MKSRLQITIIFSLLTMGIGACDQSIEPGASSTPQQLAFCLYGPYTPQGVYVLETNGTSFKRLTPDSLWTPSNYSFSPDGESLLFSVYVNQSSDIWKIARHNRVVTRVVTDAAIDDSPQWLHDGSGFVFRSNRTGRYSLWMCDANGNNQRQIIPDTANTLWPIASPQRPFIAFSYSAKRLIVLDYQQNILIPVTPDSLETTSSYFGWSKRGNRLAFEVDYDLYTWEYGGSIQRRWTDNNYIFNPTWSPDEQHIAFSASGTLKVLNLSSQTARVLSSGMVYAGRSAWSPDGKIIAVEAHNPPTVMLVKADGSSSTTISLGENAARAPRWINAIW